MNDFLRASLLGLVQGLTEFLPISSTSHLMIFQHFLGLREPEVLFDVILHVGTIGSILFYFYKPILSLFNLKDKATQKMWWYLILATLATGAVGFPLKKMFEAQYANLYRMAITLAITGVLLYASGWVVKRWPNDKDLNWKIALLMGIGQAIALEPGISRSATTICFALFCGVKREEAFRFSMLMLIPGVLGASILELRDGVAMSITWPAAFVGVLIAFVFGYLTLWWLKRLVVSDHFSRFAYYCWAVAIFVIFLNPPR